MTFQKTRTEITKISNDVKRGIEQELRIKRKVVTKKTTNSLKASSDISDLSQLTAEVTTGKSLQYIIRGRNPNGKFPVQKVNGKFELFPDLAKWKRTLNLKMPDYMLSRKIARDGIKPTPIISDALDKLNIEDRLEAAFEQDLVNVSITEVNEVFLKL